MTETKFKGLGTALITPFKNGGEIDWPAIERLIEFQISGGVDFLVIGGTTGEGVTIEEEELPKLLKFCKEKINGRIKLICGASGNNTRLLVKKITGLNGVQPDAYLVASPYYNKPTQDGLLLHYAEVSKAAGEIPIILYNVPGRTAGWIMPETVLKLAQKHKNIAGIKEASCDMNFALEMFKTVSALVPGFSFLSGEDTFILPLMSIGYNGAVAVVSNQIPRQIKDLVNAVSKGDISKAAKLHYEYLELMELNFIETNPGPVKYALKRMGYCDGSVRLPLVPMKDTAKMDSALKKIL